MGICIGIASGKGGVGKTTCSALIAKNLANLGKNVLAIDFDIGLRNLDLLLNMEDSCVYDLRDHIINEVPLIDCVSKSDKIKGLSFIPSPNTILDVSRKKLTESINTLKSSYDFVIIDCCAGIGNDINIISEVCEKFILVTTPDVISVRDVSTLCNKLYKNSKCELELIINNINPKSIEKNKSYFVPIDTIIHKIGIKLLGLIPYDENIFSEDISFSNQCFVNIAKRILGEDIKPFKFWQKKYMKNFK